MKAEHILRNVDEGVKFYFCNGRTARNLYELLEGIKSLNDKEYEHHVYTDHNDFSNWLFDVVGDAKLGRDLYHADKRKALALIKARINYLEKLKELRKKITRPGTITKTTKQQ